MAVRPGDDSDDSPETQFFTCKGCSVRKPLVDFYKTPSGHRHECKVCIRRKRRENYATNRAERIAYSTQWNQDHRERHNEIHRERHRRLQQAGDTTNRERLRVWREENPEKWLAQQKRAAAIERRRGFPNAQKRRALSYGAFVEHVNKQVVYDACEGICAICEEPVSFKAATLDHIVPLCRGGLHCYDNIQIAHGYCNRRKGSKLMEELDDDLRYASAPKKKKPYYNSPSYRQAQIDRQRRTA